MQPTTYDGPRHGDYVRYVDELLRTSPLYRSAAQGWMAQGRSDFTDVVATPGAQPQSVVERMREQVREAADKARMAARQAQQAAQPMPPVPPAAGRPPAGATGKAARTVERARQAAGHAGQPAKKPWASPGQWIWFVIALVLAVVVPGIGPFILLLTIVNALVKGFRNGLKSAK